MEKSDWEFKREMERTFCDMLEFQRDMECQVDQDMVSFAHQRSQRIREFKEGDRLCEDR